MLQRSWVGCTRKELTGQVHRIQLAHLLACLHPITGVGAKAHQPGRHHAAELMDAAGLHPAGYH